MSEPIPYATPLPVRSNHDTIYTALLGAVTFFIFIGVVEMVFLAYRQGQMSQSAGVLWMIAAIYAVLLLLAIAVLAIRIAWPRYRKWVTMTLNIILLIIFPFGTALGIYGLWKVDKHMLAR